MPRPSVHVERVVLAPDVILACMTQALTTEAEEVMGLLIGDVVPADGDADADAHAPSTPQSSSSPPRVVVRAWRAIPQLRVDRRRDRVETSPEQIARAAEEAAAEARRLGRPPGSGACRVVGWFHSHPHITALPSHVDVATQARYQMFADPAFVGVIASVFNDDAGGGGTVGGGSREQRVSLSAFQAAEARGTSGQGLQAEAEEQARARQALEGLDEATRRAILEAAGGDLSAALAGTTLSSGGGGGGGGAGGGEGSWVARLVPLGAATTASGSGSGSGSEGPLALPIAALAGRAREDYVAVFRTLLEEERFAADKRARRRRGGRAAAAAGAAGGGSPPLIAGRPPGEEAARLLAEVQAGARRQRGVCGLVGGALAPALHLARLRAQAAPLSAAGEREAAERLRLRAGEARARDAAARERALAGMMTMAAAGMEDRRAAAASAVDGAGGG